MSRPKDDNHKESSGITYVPQEEKYLRGDPADIMLNSFYSAMGVSTAERRPTVLYKRCQRWGGAYTVPPVHATQTMETTLQENMNNATTTVDSNEDLIANAMINHGATWEICTSTLPHVTASGSGLFCAGDYIYPTPTTTGSNNGNKKSRMQPMDPKDIHYITALIQKHGANNYKQMAKDVAVNTRTLTMGKIAKMGEHHAQWCAYKAASAAASAAEASTDAASSSWLTSSFLDRHCERAFNSGRATASHVLRLLNRKQDHQRNPPLSPPLLPAPLSPAPLLPPAPKDRAPLCLEVCCDSLESVAAALQGGCQRIELCSALGSGGLTPSLGLLKRVHKYINGRIPIHVLLRPREGDFIYTPEEMNIMLEDIQLMSVFGGASGIVLGVLTAAGEVDVAKTSQLIQCARHYGLSVTYHRAIDASANLMRALDCCMGLGVDRILTSGGGASAMEGQETLAQLVVRAASAVPAVVIMAGAGLSEVNVQALMHLTGVCEVHGSLKGVLFQVQWFFKGKV